MAIAMGDKVTSEPTEDLTVSYWLHRPARQKLVKIGLGQMFARRDWTPSSTSAGGGGSL